MSNEGKAYRLEKIVTKEEVNRFKFDGFDFCELFCCFGIEREQGCQSSDPLRAYLEDVLMDMVEEEFSSASKKVRKPKSDFRVKACRRYVKALERDCEKWNHCAPLWKGLNDIQNDGVFMDIFITLLPRAWT